MVFMLSTQRILKSPRLLRFTQSFRCVPRQTMSLATRKEPLLMIPGPIEFDEEVLKTMSTVGTSHMDANFQNMFGEALEMMRQVCLTKNGQAFIVAGSGTMGWDMAAANLVEPGEKVLVLNTGLFGDRFGECLEVYGAKVKHLKAPFGDRPSDEEIEAELKKEKYKMITITHVDTSSGVLNDVQRVSKVVKRVSPETLICVDGVCAVAAETLRMDDWGVDLALTASQKALGCPPGLCVVVASERAIATFEARKSPVNAFYVSWKKWLPIMKSYEARKAQYFATPAVQLIMALNVSLKQVLAKGMDTRFKEHADASDKFKDAVEAMGLKLVPVSREKAAHAMTAIRVPEGLSLPEIIPKILAQKVMVAGGLHPDYATTYFRVGTMGITVTDEASRHYMAITLAAIEKALKDAGYKFPANYKQANGI